MTVKLTKLDLNYILAQIDLSFAGQEPANPILSFGLRQIAGTNNNLAAGFGFERVMLAADGYNGYVNIRNASYLRRPGENFEVPAANYFALGDNSRGSSDSRFWGTVPEENVVGRGLFVYWPPLNGHIGLIR